MDNKVIHLLNMQRLTKAISKVSTLDLEYCATNKEIYVKEGK